MTMTAKVIVQRVEQPGGAGPGTTTVHFGPDYDDDRNKEWSIATPALSLVMTVKDDVAARNNLVVGQRFTLPFEPEDSPNPASGEDPGTRVG